MTEIRRMFDPSYSDIVKMLNKNPNSFVMFEIHKEDIDSDNFARLDKFFKSVNEIGVTLRQGCGISVSGYDDISDELHEIEPVRKYVAKMFRRYPHLLYFINRDFEYDHWILASFADEIDSIKPHETYGMSSIEVADKYGAEPPRLYVHMTFYGDKFTDVLRKTISFGKKIGDKKGATAVAQEYADKFNIKL